MKRFLAICCLILLGPTAHELRAAPPAAKARPNFLWITFEDMSPNLGCYGDRDAITPHLDALAARSVRFSHAFAPAGVCAIARSSLIMGMYASSLGTQHMRCTATLSPGIRPFPAYLRAAGYYCSNNAKTDYNFETPEGVWDESNRRAHWRNRRTSQPFFSVFNANETHESFVRGGTRATHHDPACVTPPPYLPDTPPVRREWASYLSLITVADREHVQRRLAELEADGLADDTIVFFFSDHGAGFPRAKQFIFESGLQVPLLIHFPEKWRHLAPSGPGSVCDRLVSFVDFGPTLLSLAGVSAPAHLQGQVFLGPQAAPPREYVFAIRDRMDERYDLSRTVRDRRYKYHRNYMPYLPHFPWLDYMDLMDSSRELRRLKAEGKLEGGLAYFMADRKAPEELYDLEADPYELHNLAASPAHRETLDRLRAAHHSWVVETVDSGFFPEFELRRRAQNRSEYEAVRGADYPLARIQETALLMDAGASALPELKERLADDDAAVRFWAANGLTNLGTQAAPAAAALTKALADPVPEVRIAAAQALCRIGKPASALPVLSELLLSPHLELRLAAANVLDRIGAQARPATEAMRTARVQPWPDRLNVLFVWVLDHALRTLDASSEFSRGEKAELP